MEHFEGLDILGQGGPLIDDSFEFFVLFFESSSSLPMLADELLGLYFEFLCELSDFFIFHYNAFVKIGS